MCELYYELRQNVPTLQGDKMTQLCPTCNSTTPTAIEHLLTPTLCKSYILFTLLHQNTQALRWKTIVNTNQPVLPSPQYYPLPTAPKSATSPSPGHVPISLVRLSNFKRHTGTTFYTNPRTQPTTHHKPIFVIPTIALSPRNT